MQERAMRERACTAAVYSSSRASVRGRGQWRRSFCGSRETPDSAPSPQSPTFGYQSAQYYPQSASPHRPVHPNSGFRSHANGALPRQAWQRPPAPADFRKWQLSSLSSPPESGRFSVLSYNILADYLARDHRSKLYFHIPLEILDWEWRRNRLLIEFGLWSPDIMCLQEVDRFPELEKDLKRKGYHGVWKMRTGDAVDGCAIFWRESRFELIHEENIEFAKLDLRDNVAQICVFESKRSHSLKFPEASSDRAHPPFGNDRIVVCNIHVLFNPKRGDIKLGQVRTLLNQAHSVSKAWDDAPVIICGDFNSIPKSPLYNFISEQKLNLSGLARNQISGQYSPIFYPPRVFINNNNKKISTKKTFSEMEITAVDMVQDSKMITTEEKEETESQELTVIEISEEESRSNLSIISAEGDKAVTIKASSSHWISESVRVIADPEILDKEKCDDAKDGEVNHSFLEELHGDSGRRVILEKPQTFSYPDPFIWTPEEIAAATGDAERTVMEHNLKLTSVYTEVEDYGGTKDTNREPMVTSYHRQFMGTVDYIWRSEGLQTVRVLDTIPQNVLRRTAGFPTRKWGSDHIALVCEFAIKKS